MAKDVLLDNMTDPEVALLFGVLQDGTREWRDELGDVSEDALFWQPITGNYSIASILLHIAAVEGYWLQDILTGAERTLEEQKRLLWDQTDVDAGHWALPPPHNLEWFYAEMDAVRERTKAAISTVRIGDLSHPTRQGNVLTLRWLLSHVIQHDSYHGGQAVLLHEMYKRGLPRNLAKSVTVE